MPFRETKRNTDAEKASEVGKQRKADTQPSTTFEQRCARYMPFLITTLTLGGARVIEAVSVAESNNVTALPDRMRHATSKSLPGPDVPLVKVMPEAVSLPGGSTSSENIRQLWPRLSEAMEKHFAESNHPSTSLRDGPKEAQGTSREETSQSTMETHQGEKGRDPLSSHGEMIETLRSVIDKLNEKQVRERSLLERASEIPAARMLLTDEQSTCQDPCSDTPASLDCIKQCTTPVANDASSCLDVSLSDVIAKLEPAPGLPAPHQQIRLNYTLSVLNTCTQTVKDVEYQVHGAGKCLKTLQFFYPNSRLLAPGKSASVKAGQDLSMTASCWGSPPSFLSSYISASGTDTTNFAAVSSPYKTFIVQGDRSYVMSECPQTCPSETDTPPPPTMNAPKTPSETDAPSIVFVHGIKIGPKVGSTYLPWKGSDSGWDCGNEYWGDAMRFLRNRGLTDLRAVKYYTGDENCENGNNKGIYNSDLHNPLYNSNCTDYHAGKEGTNDESLHHVSCLFAQYLHHNFGQSNSEVILVAHSMGGIIVRETLHQVGLHAGQRPFPETIGRVTKAITFNSPHGGVRDITTVGCLGCQQSQDLGKTSELMIELSTDAGKNPQPDLLTKGLTTEWTVIASECDNVVGGPLNPNSYANAVNMNADHAVVYAEDKRKKSINTCYDHGGALKDQSTNQDAQRYDCDTSDTGYHPCGIDYKDKNLEGEQWTSTKNGLRGLSQLYYSITGRLPDAPSGTRMAGKLPSGVERIGSNGRLSLLLTAVTAWALLRR